jgi:predicted dehydrogenase
MKCFQDKKYHVYFDAQSTGFRFEAVKAAAEAGKHIYCEKPAATDTQKALEMYRICESAGVKHGVVQDKLWLPGLRKLKRLIDQDFLAGFFR